MKLNSILSFELLRIHAWDINFFLEFFGSLGNTTARSTCWRKAILIFSKGHERRDWASLEINIRCRLVDNSNAAYQILIFLPHWEQNFQLMTEKLLSEKFHLVFLDYDDYDKCSFHKLLNHFPYRFAMKLRLNCSAINYSIPSAIQPSNAINLVYSKCFVIGHFSTITPLEITPWIDQTLSDFPKKPPPDLKSNDEVTIITN